MREKILRTILSDPAIKEKYSITDKQLDTLKNSPPYSKKIIEVLYVIINEEANHLSNTQIYKKIKNIHKI